jgi:GxxExxY protein
MATQTDDFSKELIGHAIEVHRALGPGLLESVYEECLCFELKSHNIPFRRQVPLPVVYKSVQLECGYRMDLVVNESMVVEPKTVERLLAIHEAQLLSCLQLSWLKLGLLLNFSAPVLKDGIKRMALNRPESP